MLNWIKSITLGTGLCTDMDMLKMIKDAGFEGIDMGFSGGFFEGDWEKKTHEIKDCFEKAGLKCAQVHLPYYNIFESSEVYIEEKEREMRSSFKCMSILGAKWGAYHPMSSTNFDYDPKRAMHDNREKLKNYLEEASKYNVGIAVENLPVFPDCSQYNFFTSNYEDHCELVDSLDSELIGACWDFGHANLMPYDMSEVLDVMGDRIKIVHMHNNTEMCDLHIAPCIGTIKWEKMIPVLVKHGYSGPLNLELNLNLIMPELKKDYLELCSKAADLMLNMD